MGEIVPQPTIGHIIGATAEYHGITRDLLLSRNRIVLVTRARHQAMYLAYELTGRSYRSIGSSFARDYSGVRRSCLQVGGHLDDDREPWCADVAAVRARLGVRWA